MSQWLSYSLAGSLLRPTMPKLDLSIDLLSHSYRMTFGGKHYGFTLVGKPFLDFRRLLGGM